MGHRKSVLIYEWVLGGGAIREDTLPASLRREAILMLQAVVSDFVQADLDVFLLLDPSVSLPVMKESPGRSVHIVPFVADLELEKQLMRLAAKVDWVFLIAPETNGCLLDLVVLSENSKAQLVGPCSTFVKIASDKNETCRVLNSCRVSTPQGCSLEKFDSAAFKETPKWIVKKYDGAGSDGNLVVEPMDEIPSRVDPENWRIEEWVEGRPASLIVMSNGTEIRLAPPTWQIQSVPGGNWTDCSLMTEDGLIKRSRKIAWEVIDALPPTNGIWGIDFVLADQEENDTVIEVNPRLTSSYAFVRSHLSFNPANFLCAE